MDLFGKTPRPTFTDDMMRELAIITSKYLQESNPDEDEIERISKILKRHKDDDGFERGKKFECEGYHVDAHIISELDCVSWDATDLVSKAIKAWVISDNIVPCISVGATVKLHRTIDKKTEGVISGIIQEDASYLVHLEGQKETSNYVIAYELIENANPHLVNTVS